MQAERNFCEQSSCMYCCCFSVADICIGSEFIEEFILSPASPLPSMSAMKQYR